MRGTLQETDVFALSPYFRHRNLFRKYLSYTAAYPDHSLLWFLLTSNSLDLILDIVLELWSATAGRFFFISQAHQALMFYRTIKGSSLPMLSKRSSPRSPIPRPQIKCMHTPGPSSLSLSISPSPR